VLAAALGIVSQLWAPSVKAGEAKTYECKPGPWGRLEYQYIYLSVPNSVLDQFPMPRPGPEWCFPEASSVKVHEFLKNAGLDPKVVDRLVSDTRSHPDAEGVVTLYPTLEDVVNLPPATRDAIYQELAKSELNPYLYQPICIPDGDFAAWLQDSGLPDNVADFIRKTSYREGGSVLFGDLKTLMGLATSDSEARRWVKAITRTRAVVAWLVMDPKDDLAGLRRYWSADFHRKDALPMLEAVDKWPGGAKLDLTHLLPPFARSLVYGYTTPDIERNGQTPNCHWTSLNFFNYTRQDIFMDLKLASSQVLEDYEKAAEPYQFGDVLFFLNDAGNAYHSCVYIADNLVFSKNGENTMMPWILTRMEDVKQLYLHQPGQKILVFRRRWPEEDL